MSADRLVHYGAQPLGPVRSMLQHAPEMKPRGLWVTVDRGEPCWREWCEGEGFRLTHLRWRHQITLAPEARLVLIRTPEELHAFDAIYARDIPGVRLSRKLHVDWPAVAQEFDGILITPYLWSERMGDVAWYYPWDCASGCIWNAGAIACVTAELVELNPRPSPSAIAAE